MMRLQVQATKEMIYKIQTRSIGILSSIQRKENSLKCSNCPQKFNKILWIEKNNPFTKSKNVIQKFYVKEFKFDILQTYFKEL